MLRKFIQASLLIFLSQTAMSANLSTEEIRLLQQKMKSATQLSVDFVQVKTNSIRPNQKIRSVGRATFAKPAKFRWTITKPKADALVFDGDNLYSLQEDQKTATSFNAKGDRVQEIREVIDLVLDFDALLARYEIVESKKDLEKVILALKPKSKGALTALDVRIDSAKATVESVKMSFSNKNTSELEFSNPDRSMVGKETFSVPAGYKILKGL